MKLLLVVTVVALTVALVNGYRGFGGGGYGGGKGYGGKPFQTKGNYGGPEGWGQGKYPPRQTGRGCPIGLPKCLKENFKQISQQERIKKLDRLPIVRGTGPGTVPEGGMCYTFADCISGLMCKRSHQGAAYGTCQRVIQQQAQQQQQPAARPPSPYDNVPETQQGRPAGYAPPQQSPEQGRRYIPGQGWVDGR